MHNIEVIERPYDCDKKEVAKYIEDEANEHGDGLYCPIEWLDLKLKDLSEADKYIDEHDETYRQFAVSYYGDVMKVSAATKKFKDKFDKLNQDYNELNNKIHYRGVKSQFVQCKNCGSKLSTKYLNTNSCPVCGKELRPESTVKKINDLRKKVIEAKDAYNESLILDRNLNKRVRGLKWLIKYEYHS